MQGTHLQCSKKKKKPHLLLAGYELGQRKHALCFSFILDFTEKKKQTLGIKTMCDISGTDTYANNDFVILHYFPRNSHITYYISFKE